MCGYGCVCVVRCHVFFGCRIRISQSLPTPPPRQRRPPRAGLCSLDLCPWPEPRPKDAAALAFFRPTPRRPGQGGVLCATGATTIQIGTMQGFQKGQHFDTPRRNTLALRHQARTHAFSGRSRTHAAGGKQVESRPGCVCVCWPADGFKVQVRAGCPSCAKGPFDPQSSNSWPFVWLSKPAPAKVSPATLPRGAAAPHSIPSMCR